MRVFLASLTVCLALQAQTVRVRPAPYLAYPSPIVDGNSPGLWVDGRLKVYTSTGELIKMSGPDLFSLWNDLPPEVDSPAHFPMWIESLWRDPSDGLVYAWYHHEPGGYCPGKGLTVPRIGALLSRDGGDTFEDLGIVLSSGDPPDCNAQNRFFAGGHGDFSVVYDQGDGCFYFVFDNYGGPASTQGVSLARLAYEDRATPAGHVWKHYQGAWDQPGVGGRSTPVLPVRTAWEKSNTDAFWGPSVSWNSYLERYVILLNRACCQPGWPQEGIYLAISADLSDPASWSAPVKILTPRDIGFAPGYYPQLVGKAVGETDSLTSQGSRLFVKGISRWELFFEDPPPPTVDPEADPKR
ncbi:MAG: hypothetical protein K2X03_28025 [Bryobacteraceae bacterium]|nr:hypothetical protein [Bryobacteraceae bacterium]